MGLESTAYKGLAWTTASTIVRSVVSLLQVSILTRFIDKADFGIVAIASLFIGFSSLFLDLGISSGILHRNDTTPKQYSSLFWLNIMMGVLLSGILCIISPIVARAYDQPELVKVLTLLSLNMLFSSIGIQHKTIQQKKMRFRTISIIEILSSTLTLILAIILAVKGFGVYSLVYSTMFNMAFSNITFLVVGLMKDSNISFHFRFSETLPYLKIGIFSIGSSIADYFSTELDTIIISATLGESTLGVYSLCKKLVSSLFSMLNTVLGKVITPVFAKIQNDLQQVKNVFFATTRALSIACSYAASLVCIFSYGILYYLYGDQYVDAYIVLCLLSLFMGKNASGNPVGGMQIALGRTDLGFYWTLCRIASTAIAIGLGSLISLEAMLVFQFSMTFIMAPISWLILTKPMIHCGFWENFNMTFLPFVVATLSGVPFFFLFRNVSSIPMILLGFVSYSVVYLFLIRFFFRDSYAVRTMNKLIGKFSPVKF